MKMIEINVYFKKKLDTI